MNLRRAAGKGSEGYETCRLSAGCFPAAGHILQTGAQADAAKKHRRQDYSQVARASRSAPSAVCSLSC